MMINVVRFEYKEWEMEYLLDSYEKTKDETYLKSAQEIGAFLMENQFEDGSIPYSNKNSTVYNGEVGLFAWGLYRIYQITKENNYLIAADRAMDWIERHPEDNTFPRLKYTYISWNNYARIEKSRIVPNYIEVLKEKANYLIKSQSRLGYWTICLHYDLYVARSLFYTYKFTKDEKYLKSVKKFIIWANIHKVKGLYPIHIKPQAWREGPSGYSSNQMVQLLALMGRKEEANKIVDLVQKKLIKEGQCYKLLKEKKPNELATIWVEHNKLLLQ